MEHTVQEETAERSWQTATRIVIALTLLGGGYMVAYLRYGDAVSLRANVKQKQTRIDDLEHDRETMTAQKLQATKDKDGCEKDLTACKGGGGAAQ